MHFRRRPATVVVAAVTAVSVVFAGPAALAAGKVKHFDLKGEANRPYSIVVGPDGNMWFTESDGNAIGRITPDGKLKRFVLKTPDSHPYGITVGPDGNLWFTERIANRIGVINTSGKVLAEYDLPTVDAQPWDIALGGDGGLWFTEENVDQLGHITVDGTITEYPLTPGVFPTSIAADGRGNIWFTEEIGNAIGRLRAADADPMASLQIFPVPTEQSLPWDLVASRGADGHDMFFTELAGHKIARINPAGKIVEHPVAGDSGVAGLTIGPNQTLWFTRNDSGEVGVMNLDGEVLKTYATRPYPFGITDSPNGDIWFCEGYGNSIGRIKAS